MKQSLKRLMLLAPLALAACGTLPEPFYGNPGAVAAKLATPPAPILMIPTPGTALLDDKSAAAFADDLAAALVNYDVPSIAGAAAKGNWQLGISATLQGNDVIPSYAITGPDGKTYGRQSGAPVPAQGWANGDSGTLQAAAGADAAMLSKALGQINAQIQQSNPESLENRTPRIFVTGVSGAPGDGNSSLALNLARDLPGPDLEVVTDKAKADFTVAGAVKAKPDTGGQELVELDWVVRDENDRVAGQVTQLHDLSPSDISPYWGDVAAAAAAEAANGVQNVVQNAVLKKAPAKPTPQADSPTPAPAPPR